MAKCNLIDWLFLPSNAHYLTNQLVPSAVSTVIDLAPEFMFMNEDGDRQVPYKQIL